MVAIGEKQLKPVTHGDSKPMVLLLLSHLPWAPPLHSTAQHPPDTMEPGPPSCTAGAAKGMFSL